MHRNCTIKQSDIAKLWNSLYSLGFLYKGGLVLCLQGEVGQTVLKEVYTVHTVHGGSWLSENLTQTLIET